jgi:hypothetical protein
LRIGIIAAAHADVDGPTTATTPGLAANAGALRRHLARSTGSGAGFIAQLRADRLEQRRPPPEAEPLAQPRRGAVRPALVHRLLGVGQRAPEALDVPSAAFRRQRAPGGCPRTSDSGH